VERSEIRGTSSCGSATLWILTQLRSDLATHYLGEANLSISEVAWLVGY
jgi:transcriptional regulator GlxA family with amidase domain